MKSKLGEMISDLKRITNIPTPACLATLYTKKLIDWYDDDKADPCQSGRFDISTADEFKGLVVIKDLTDKNYEDGHFDYSYTTNVNKIIYLPYYDMYIELKGGIDSYGDCDGDLFSCIEVYRKLDVVETWVDSVAHSDPNPLIPEFLELYLGK